MKNTTTRLVLLTVFAFIYSLCASVAASGRLTPNIPLQPVSSLGNAAQTPAATGQKVTQNTAVATHNLPPSSVASFIQETRAAHPDIDVNWLTDTLQSAEQIPAIIRLMQPAPAQKPANWQAYRERLVETRRIYAGVKFWLVNRRDLERAERMYGVPAEIIVGIIGIESFYGKHMGKFRVLDALYSLAFSFPPEHPRAEKRSQFFRQELTQFLIQHAAQQTDPQSTLGSYAGAIGLPQFMPSSVRDYAVDFNGDGKIDLINSAADAIGSIAHYFQAFGWQSGMAATYPVTISYPVFDSASLLERDILPSFKPTEFSSKGATLEAQGLLHNGLLALIKLENGDAAPSYFAGTANFYTITRYNKSSYYAMAVLELGQAVREKMPPSILRSN